jgi:hypothetical protein
MRRPQTRNFRGAGSARPAGLVGHALVLIKLLHSSRKRSRRDAAWKDSVMHSPMY